MIAAKLRHKDLVIYLVPNPDCFCQVSDVLRSQKMQQLDSPFLETFMHSRLEKYFPLP